MPIVVTHKQENDMNNNEAVQIIKDAIGYSTKEHPAKNMQNAIGCFYELLGWSKEDFAISFVEFCLAGAKAYKTDPMHSYILKVSNDASNVALYIDRQASYDIKRLRGVA